MYFDLEFNFLNEKKFQEQLQYEIIKVAMELTYLSSGTANWMLCLTQSYMHFTTRPKYVPTAEKKT